MRPAGSLKRVSDGDGRQLTGRKVFILLVGFFGFVMVVNVFMVHAAITTFGGVDTPSSYQAGLAFKSEERDAAEQAARAWRVEAKISSTADGSSVSISVADDAGRPVTGADIVTRLSHPIDERRDITVPVAELGAGNYFGRVRAEPGQWTLFIDIFDGDDRVFRSRNRVMFE